MANGMQSMWSNVASYYRSVTGTTSSVTPEQILCGMMDMGGGGAAMSSFSTISGVSGAYLDSPEVSYMKAGNVVCLTFRAFDIGKGATNGQTVRITGLPSSLRPANSNCYYPVCGRSGTGASSSRMTGLLANPKESGIYLTDWGVNLTPSAYYQYGHGTIVYMTKE